MPSINAINHWEDVPIFDSEQAEAVFWADHRPDLRLMETAVAGTSEGSESVTIDRKSVVGKECRL